MNSGQNGYAEKEFLVGPDMIGRIGISVNYSGSGMLEVDVRGFSGSEKVAKDTHSARRVKDAVEEVVGEITKEADPYSYLRMVGLVAEKCDKKNAEACDECCKYKHLPKCSAPETGKVTTPLNEEQLAEFGRGFRIVLRDGIKELVIEA